MVWGIHRENCSLWAKLILWLIFKVIAESAETFAVCLLQVSHISSDGLHDVMEWLIKHQPSSSLTWWNFYWTSRRRSETHLLSLPRKPFIMIDLSYLTEEEQEMILTVLKRDAELKKLEEQRIKWVQAKDSWWIKTKP